MDENIERELQERQRRKQQKQEEEDRRNAFHLADIKREAERARTMIALYKKIGDEAFEWAGSGDKDNPHPTQMRKFRTWESIQAKRYEEARFNINELIRLKKADSDTKDWLYILEYILDNEATTEKYSRLGFRGVLDYPIDYAGCSNSLGSCLFLLLVIPGIFITINYFNSGNEVSGVICASALLFLYLVPSTKWQKYNKYV